MCAKVSRSTLRREQVEDPGRDEILTLGRPEFGGLIQYLFGESRLQDVNDASSPETPVLSAGNWFSAVRGLPDLYAAVGPLCS